MRQLSLLVADDVLECRKCSKKAPATLEFFIPHKGCRNGIRPCCRECWRETQRAWLASGDNKERKAASRRASYARKTGPLRAAERLERIVNFPIRSTARRLRNSVADRAKERNLPLASELRKIDFIEWWLLRQPNCECCGTAFNHGLKNGVKADDSASFDQFFPGHGYLLKNVRLICWRCNNIKRNYAANDLRKVADWIEKSTKFQPEAPHAAPEPAGEAPALTVSQTPPARANAPRSSVGAPNAVSLLAKLRASAGRVGPIPKLTEELIRDETAGD